MTAPLLLPLLLLSGSTKALSQRRLFWPFDAPTTTTTVPPFGDTDRTLRIKQRDDCMGHDVAHAAITRSRCKTDASQFWKFNRTIQNYAGDRMCLSMARQPFVGGSCSYWNGTSMVRTMRVELLTCNDADDNQRFVTGWPHLIVSQKCSDLCLAYRILTRRFELRPCNVTLVNQNMTLVNVSEESATRFADTNPEIDADNIIGAASANDMPRIELSLFRFRRGLATLSYITAAAVASVFVLALVSVTRLREDSSHPDVGRASWSPIPTEEGVSRSEFADCELTFLA